MQLRRTSICIAALGAVACAAWLASPWTRASSVPLLNDTRLDAMDSPERWLLGGARVVYSLGGSDLAATGEHPRAGAPASLRLDCDFSEPRREWVGAIYVGRPVRRNCRAVSLWVWSNGSAARLRITLEDDQDRLFERDLASLDWHGWRKVEAPVEDGTGWTPLTRSGEEPVSLCQPVAVSRVSVCRTPDTPQRVISVLFSDLRASVEASGLDSMEATLSTGRSGNLFAGDAPGSARLVLRNNGAAVVTGTLAAEIIPTDGEAIRLKPQAVSVRGRSTLSQTIGWSSLRYGAYTLRAVLRSGLHRRGWAAHIAVVRSSDVPSRTSDSPFGASGNIEGFSGSEMPLVNRLSRGAGIAWARLGLSWEQVNPARGVWAWDPLQRIPGPVGYALRTGGRVYRVPDSPILSTADEVTLAFWARVAGPNGRRQSPVHKWGEGDRRNYGAYFDSATGCFAFSAGYERRVGTYTDFDSGFSAWDGQWHHFAATYSRHVKQVCLYVDGSVRAASFHDGGRLRTTGAPLTFGEDCPCDLDEVVLYRRALGPADVAALARKERPPRDGIMGRWTFDEAQGPALNWAGTGAGPLESGDPDGMRAARSARAQGMEPLVILGFPPDWASSARAEAGAERLWVHAPARNAWSAYVEGVARQYRDVVRCWEVWNEPNTEAFWQPRPDARAYLETLKTAYAAAKRGNPRCKVVMPGLAGPSDARAGMAYMEQLLAMGGGRYCDAISIHPYRLRPPEETGLAEDIRHIAKACASRGPSKPIWITETSWPSEAATGSSERRQAALLARSYVLALSTGLVEKIMWFRLHDSGPDRFYPEDNLGLCYNDLTPKPAFFAHRTIAVLLGRARPVSAGQPARKVRLTTFHASGESLAAAWSSDGQRWVAVDTGKPRVQVTDLMGNSELRRTDGGVLLLHLGDLITFVRNLPPKVSWLGDLVSIPPVRVRPGGSVRVPVRIRNPFRDASAFPVRAAPTEHGRPAHGLRVTPPLATIKVPARGTANLVLTITAPASGDRSEARLAVEVRMRGKAVGEEADVELR